MTKELKQGIHCLLCKATKLLQQRLNFPFEKREIKELKRRIDCLQEEAKTLLKQRLDFSCDKGIETTERLPAIPGQKIVKTAI